VHEAAHDDEGRAAGDAGNGQPCFKCCGVCTTVGTYTIERRSGDVLLTTTPVVYRIATQSVTGEPVIIDPGIPKRMD
jgi:hypothetical protein